VGVRSSPATYKVISWVAPVVEFIREAFLYVTAWANDTAVCPSRRVCKEERTVRFKNKGSVPNFS
ncbi:hypothetical protein, partial [Desulfobulbus alkaliphilus]|uniref:hypothetical protein n=1 Tax=Desulfobulbus alkaliphilus TaxID=869814 RepID=UPI001964F629